MAPCENGSSWALRLPAGAPRPEEAFPGLLGDEGGGGADCGFWNGTGNCSLVGGPAEVPVKLNKFQIIKAVVLAGVTVVIMVSICRMVFQLFVRYNVRQDR